MQISYELKEEDLVPLAAADSAHSYLWLGKTEAMIVPKGAFASEAEADVFYQQALANRKNAPMPSANA